jgi:hypothetical protein
MQVEFDFSETFNESLMATVRREIMEGLLDIMRAKCPVRTGRLLWSEGGAAAGGLFMGGQMVKGQEVVVGAGLKDGPPIADLPMSERGIKRWRAIATMRRRPTPRVSGDSSYAYWLQVGTKWMAPRPLLPTEDEVVQVLQEVFSRHAA